MLVQGASWAAAKSEVESDLHKRAASLRTKLTVVELIVFILVSFLFLFTVVPNSAVGLTVEPLAIAFAVLYLVGLAGVFASSSADGKRDVLAVVFAGVACLGMVGAWAAATFPYLIPATVADMSVTVASAASSDTSLTAMTIIACIGVPLVLVYHVIVYRIFRGRIPA